MLPVEIKKKNKLVQFSKSLKIWLILNRNIELIDRCCSGGMRVLFIFLWHPVHSYMLFYGSPLHLISVFHFLQFKDLNDKSYTGLRIT